MKGVLRSLAWLCAALLGSVLTFAALVPVHVDSREALFEIPKGTWARRHAGASIDILPSEIRLVLGLRDVLVLRNLDEVPQTFGPTLLMPGQSVRLPFSVASEYDFACTAHLSGEMRVIVADGPTSAVSRLRYRVNDLVTRVSRL